MMETEYLDIKHDCMWSGNCDRKCANNYKMESLMGKSTFTNENLDLYLNLCGSQTFGTNCQDSIEFLDSLDSEDFNVDFILNEPTNVTNNNSMPHSNLNNIQATTYYQSQPNYSSSNQMTNTNHLKLATNSINTSNHTFNNQTTNTNQNSSHFQHPTSNQSLSVLNSSLNTSTKSDRFNDLLLSSTSENIILTQHNHTIDSNSQLNSNHHSITNYTPNHLDNLSNLNNLDLIPNTNRCTELVACGSDELNGSLEVNHNTQLNAQQQPHDNQFNTNYQTHLNTMMSNYTFDNHLIDSNFCNGVDSAGSSNNSECSSACLLERTDYDTDDIEDDLDLLEDIIEEEFDEGAFATQGDLHAYQSRTNYRSIANSVESSSDVDMSMSSPISDSLINDHSYGASSIEKAYEKVSSAYNGRTLVNNVTITTSSSNHHRMSSTNNTIIHHNNRISKRRSMPSLNQNASNSRRNMQRHSGTSLLMKEKQMKMKKVMDTDRRKEHNESERMRRDVLKNAFLMLRNKCPKLSNSVKKSSRIQILNEATFYIKQIKDKHSLLDDARVQERKRNEELKARLMSLGGC